MTGRVLLTRKIMGHDCCVLPHEPLHLRKRQLRSVAAFADEGPEHVRQDAGSAFFGALAPAEDTFAVRLRQGGSAKADGE
jgi:hypothetical protein